MLLQGRTRSEILAAEVASSRCLRDVRECSPVLTSAATRGATAEGRRFGSAVTDKRNDPALAPSLT